MVPIDGECIKLFDYYFLRVLDLFAVTDAELANGVFMNVWGLTIEQVR
jgi:hypothetical protein